MKRQMIRLTEEDLKNIIKESVKQIVSENRMMNFSFFEDKLDSLKEDIIAEIKDILHTYPQEQIDIYLDTCGTCTSYVYDNSIGYGSVRTIELDNIKLDEKEDLIFTDDEDNEYSANEFTIEGLMTALKWFTTINE